MLYFLSQQFVSFLIYKKAIKRERMAIYIYGCELLFSTSFSIISILIIGLLTKRILQSIVFILFFLPIRTVANGYHADSFEKCFLYTNMTACCCIFAANWLNKPNLRWKMWLINFLAHLFIWVVGPFQSKKHPLEYAQVEQNKQYMHKIQIIELFVELLLSVLEQQILLYTSIVTTCIVVIMIIIAEKQKNPQNLNE